MFSNRITIALLSVCCVAVIPLAAADDHAGHDHAAHGHGATTPVGSTDIAGYKIAVAAAGALTPGAEWHVDLALTPTQTLPKAIRVWVGSETGRGSAKAKAELEKDAKGEYAAHVELPKPMPADAKLWIALEQADGQTAKGSVALPTAATTAVTPVKPIDHGHSHERGHHHGDGHKH